MKTNAKLFSAAMMLAVSLVMLVGASLAWFTVSTAPEISGVQLSLYTDLDLMVSKTGETNSFSQSVTMEPASAPMEGIDSIDELPLYAPLKPISTADGVNWYLPKYLPDGTLAEAKDFIPATAENCNVFVSEEDEESYEYFLADSKGYYVCADIWLMTENKAGVSVTLSVPKDRDSLEAWERGEGTGEYSEKHSNKYGSYALGKYALVGGNVARIDNNVQTALRVGFLADGAFTIWEPNADQRSSYTRKPKADQTNEPDYILDYQITDESNYGDNQYIVTRPIGLKEDGTTIGLVDLDPKHLLVQKKSAWGASLQEEENWKSPSSAHVETFGLFIYDTEALYKAAKDGIVSSLGSLRQEQASQNPIVTLAPNEPKKVTLYIWLEGQDVDCWNDIASGSFFVNLEFAATELTGGSQ